jgi:hypothetical protein
MHYTQRNKLNSFDVFLRFAMKINNRNLSNYHYWSSYIYQKVNTMMYNIYHGIYLSAQELLIKSYYPPAPQASLLYTVIKL